MDRSVFFSVLHILFLFRYHSNNVFLAIIHFYNRFAISVSSHILPFFKKWRSCSVSLREIFSKIIIPVIFLLQRWTRIIFNYALDAIFLFGHLLFFFFEFRNFIQYYYLIYPLILSCLFNQMCFLWIIL